MRFVTDRALASFGLDRVRAHRSGYVIPDVTVALEANRSFRTLEKTPLIGGMGGVTCRAPVCDRLMDYLLFQVLFLPRMALEAKVRSTD